MDWKPDLSPHPALKAISQKKEERRLHANVQARKYRAAKRPLFKLRWAEYYKQRGAALNQRRKEKYFMKKMFALMVLALLSCRDRTDLVERTYYEEHPAAPIVSDAGLTDPIHTAEVCDGIDNDGDGIIDNIAPMLCYTDDQKTLEFGPCRPGVTRCIAGVPTCIGEITPMPELCNNIDDDCNGKVDDGLGGHRAREVVFLVDASGSMSGAVIAVSAAVNDLTDVADTTYTVVGVPSYGNLQLNPPKEYLHEGTLVEAKAEVAKFISTEGAGSEPTLDGVYEFAQSDTGAKRLLFMFSDEEPQSYQLPPLTIDQVKQQLISTGANLKVFTVQGYPAGQWGFLDASPQYLNTSIVSMTTTMQGIINNAACDH